MLRVVFDTNVLVSTIISRGKPRELWNKVIDGKIRLVISEDLLKEFNEVIPRPQFRRYLKRPKLRKFQRALIQLAEISRVKTRFTEITEDPDDNMVLEAAYSGRADYIVTGDKHLLRLGEFKGIKVVTVDGMLKILKRKE